MNLPLDSLSSVATIAVTAALPPRLVKAAHEFEAAMMKELLSPLQGSQDKEDEGSLSALTSFAGEALGQAISEHGGFGIADRIIRQIVVSGNHSGNSVVTPVLKREFPVSPLK